MLRGRRCAVVNYRFARRLALRWSYGAQSHRALPTDFAEWNDWHLIIEGKKYYSLFQNIDDWRQHYQGFEQKAVRQ
jgi:hypothetical protein